MIHSVRFTAVLDTNVVYPVIIRDILFWFAYYDLYTALNKKNPKQDEFEVLNLLRNAGLKDTANYLHALL